MFRRKPRIPEQRKPNVRPINSDLSDIGQAARKAYSRAMGYEDNTPYHKLPVHLQRAWEHVAEAVIEAYHGHSPS